MNWKYPDAYPGESKAEYLRRKEEEEHSSDTIPFYGIVSLFFFLVKIAVIFGVFIYAGYFLSQKLLVEEIDKFKIWCFTLLFTYLIFSIIFFLKGIIIGLRTKNRKLWILSWLICVLLCCIVPSFLVKSMVASMFNPRERQDIWCIGLSWGAFVLSIFYLYDIYQFKTPIAPRILRWSYALGVKASQ